ncbi:hypothetical protein FACS1894184_10290 [Clostridia bacterium]|nr:hypothetical protein FACS1894184_10290 [Clostridia bacterium]
MKSYIGTPESTRKTTLDAKQGDTSLSNDEQLFITPPELLGVTDSVTLLDDDSESVGLPSKQQASPAVKPVASCAVTYNLNAGDPAGWAAAWADTTASKCIVIESDITIDGVNFPAITLPATATPQQVYLASSSGNTYTLKRGAGVTAALLTVQSNVQLTISDLIIDGDGGNTASSYALIRVLNGATVTLDDGAQVHNNLNTSPTGAVGGGIHNSGTLYMHTGASVHHNICKTLGSSALSGAGVNNDGIFMMDGGDISYNDCVSDGVHTAQSKGAGVCSGNTFIMTGGSINHNTCDSGASAYGGGVCNTNGRSMEISNADISDNTVVGGMGGGLFIFGYFDAGVTFDPNRYTLKLINTSVLRNHLRSTPALQSTAGAGMNIQHSHNNILIRNSSISENIIEDGVSGTGAGVYVMSSFPTGFITKVLIDGDTKISDNKIYAVNGSGGGVSIASHRACVGSAFTITGNTLIENNYSSGNGGGMFYFAFTDGSDENKTFELSGNTKVINNRAGNNGGGVYFDFKAAQSMSPSIVIKDKVKIDDNTADNFGGGVFILTMSLTNASPWVLFTSSDPTDGVSISRNKAKTGGGMYAIWDLKPEIVGMPNSASPAAITMAGNVSVKGNRAFADDGGGMYLTAKDVPASAYTMLNVDLQPTATIEGNEARRDGGGIYLPNIEQAVRGLHVASGVIFRNNRAVKTVVYNAVKDELRNDRDVNASEYTAPFVSGWNNDDISYAAAAARPVIILHENHCMGFNEVFTINADGAYGDYQPLPIPRRPGFRFKCWSSAVNDSNCSFKVDDNTPVTSASPRQLYAQWAYIGCPCSNMVRDPISDECIVKSSGGGISDLDFEARVLEILARTGYNQNCQVQQPTRRKFCCCDSCMNDFCGCNSCNNRPKPRNKWF